MKRILGVSILLFLGLNAVTPQSPVLKITNNTNSDLAVRVKVLVVADGFKEKGAAKIDLQAGSCGNLDLSSVRSDINASEIRIIKFRARNSDRSFTGGLRSGSKSPTKNTEGKRTAKTTKTFVDSKLADANEIELAESNSKVVISIIK
jgi:hypothetical protein